MKCECGRHISTPDFMKRLDLSQLLRAVEIAEGLIKQKTEGEKALLYRVFDDGLCVGNFIEGEYPKAVECLAGHARDMIESNAPRVLSIERQRVPVSEISDYIDNYDQRRTAATAGEREGT